MGDTDIRARVTMFIDAPAAQIYEAFIEPRMLTQFWLDSAPAPLQVGASVDWHFMVEGAVAQTTATRMEVARHLSWRWPDGSVCVDLEPFDSGTAVTVINDGFTGSLAEKVEAALNSTEGFTIVLCDLKTLLESGKSAGLTKAKARLIEARLER